MSASGNDYLAKARAAWGNELPDWIEELAKEANRITARSIAKRLGYSNATISYVISRSYKGNLKRVEETVRGALMGVTVDCPIVGEIGRDRCLEEQKMGNTGASPNRARLYHSCRSGRCPHSRLNQESDHAE
ncbi:putative transcriptional regulator [Rhodopseudomonas palustris TIE-1]|uniref:hypothetical protein n=1 Tax=Rhodopseudomonas palustris TaxID=1076 RepID=UPI000164A953|nr:hypothetical protein [Rhodopseudomonas palustris]ACF01871.1 putative transcriptional regulator [Rhodopseudomonas palustris TIE-1]